MKVLQVNADRSVRAHDMATMTAAKENVDLMIVSEPNRKLMKIKNG